MRLRTRPQWGLFRGLFSPRRPLKFHKKQLLSPYHFGLYASSFSCQTKPVLRPPFRS